MHKPKTDAGIPWLSRCSFHMSPAARAFLASPAAMWHARTLMFVKDNHKNRGGGAYPKSGGNSTLMPRALDCLCCTFCFLLSVARLASSFSPLPAGWLAAGHLAGLLAGCWMAGLLAGASGLAAWLLTGWLAAELLAGCCWLCGWLLCR